MLHPFSDLKRTTVDASDGDVGRVRDAYFDDEHWTLRYLVVDAGGWLTGRRVLVTPPSVAEVLWSYDKVRLNLTREQVKNGPGIEADKPISRQHEISFFDYYGYPYYWSGPYVWGPAALPRELAVGSRPPFADTESQIAREVRRSDRKRDPHLRSANEVSGYHIEAGDGSVGHVEDFLFDDESWSLRYFVVDTRNWLPGRDVLIAVDWIESVRWPDRKVDVALTRDEVRSSPEYRPGAIDESAQEELYRHYGRVPTREWTETRPR